ncbi:hypothetical protein ABQE93_10905 [Mycolicibacterium sp. XJ662]
MTGTECPNEMSALHDAYVVSLRIQLEDAVVVMKKKQEEFNSAKDVVARIETALNSLDALSNLYALHLYTPSADASNRQSDFVIEGESGSQWIGEVKASVSPPVAPPQLEPYVAPGGGTRLKSKRMIFDLMKVIGEPVTREQLRQRFFDHYGREELEKYWKRPDNALNTAIDRAAEDHYIEAVEVEGHDTIYTVGFQDSDTGAPAFENGDDE